MCFKKVGFPLQNPSFGKYSFWFMVEIDHQVVILLDLWYPSGKRWRLIWNPSSVRWLLFVWLCAYPSKCRGDLFLCLASKCRGCIVGERSCVLPVCIYPNPQWRFPVWEVLCGQVSGNPSCEGGDVELCARTSKHISVFAFDALSLNLSLSYIVHWFILSYHIHAWFDCVSYLC